METKHTKGPFEIRYPEGFLYTIVDGDGRIVATIDGQYVYLETSEEHEERHLADAKLFAAAPELLEALQTSNSIILSLLRGQSIRNLDEAISYNTALINKATS